MGGRGKAVGTSFADPSSFSDRCWPAALHVVGSMSDTMRASPWIKRLSARNAPFVIQLLVTRFHIHLTKLIQLTCMLYVI